MCSQILHKENLWWAEWYHSALFYLYNFVTTLFKSMQSPARLESELLAWANKFTYKIYFASSPFFPHFRIWSGLSAAFFIVINNMPPFLFKVFAIMFDFFCIYYCIFHIAVQQHKFPNSYIRDHKSRTNLCDCAIFNSHSAQKIGKLYVLCECWCRKLRTKFLGCACLWHQTFNLISSTVDFYYWYKNMNMYTCNCKNTP